MSSTDLAQAKEDAISHVRSKTADLERQSGWSRIRQVKADAKASLSTVLNGGLVTADEFEALTSDIDSAARKAAFEARRHADELDAQTNQRA